MIEQQTNATWISTLRALYRLAGMALLLVFLVTGTNLVGVYIYQQTLRNRMIDVEIPSMMRSIHNDILGRVRSAQRTAEGMASNQSLLDWESSRQPDIDMHHWLQYIERLAQKTGETSFFWISRHQGRYYNENGFLRQLDLKESRDTWLDEFLASEDECHLRSAPKELGIGHMLQVACRFDNGKANRGVTGVGLDALALTEYINAFRISPSSHVFLVNQAGQFLAHRDIVLVEKEIPFRRVIDLKPLAADLLRQQAFNLVSHDDDQGRALYASTWIPELGIYAMAQISEEEIAAPVKTSSFILAFISIIFGIALLLALVRTIRRVSRSIKAVEIMSEHVANRVDTERAVSLAAFSSMADGVIATDLAGRITYINSAACRQLGCACCGNDTSQLHGKLLSDIYHPLNNSDDSDIYALLPPKLTLQDASGKQIVISEKRVHIFNPQQDPIGELILLQDQTAEYETQKNILHQARHDPLTGLANRRRMTEYLQKTLACAQQQNSSMAVYFLDINRFKLLNDTMGHLAGDELLLIVASRLQGITRAPGLVCRQGGDEFIIIQPSCGNRHQIRDFASQIMCEIAIPIELHHHDIVVTPSIGIALCPDDGSSVEELLRNSDLALQEAKREGQSGISFYKPEVMQRIQDLVRIERGLRHAVERGEIEVHYQPQIDLANNRLLGAECLARWRHPIEGMISPARFIPVAEEAGLIVEIGKMVLHHACRQLAQWQALMPDLRLSVNLSAIQFAQDDLIGTVRAATQQFGISPTMLDIEVTESVVMDSHSSVIARMQALRDLGVTLSLDDFGTGYSSLAYLKRMPLNQIKIDSSFIRDLPNDMNDAAITLAIISMAANMGLDVIAEGVENQAQLDFLVQHGCSRIQGYFFARPMPAQEFERFMHTFSELS